MVQGSITEKHRISAPGRSQNSAAEVSDDASNVTHVTSEVPRSFFCVVRRFWRQQLKKRNRQLCDALTIDENFDCKKAATSIKWRT